MAGPLLGEILSNQIFVGQNYSRFLSQSEKIITFAQNLINFGSKKDKTFVGWNYSLNEILVIKKFVTLARTLSGETMSGKIFVGRNYSSGEIFVTKRKIRHFRPKKFRPIR